MFWSLKAAAPNKKRNFRVQVGKDVWWWAKSVTKPSFEIETQDYQLINHKHKYPGLIYWNDVTMVLYDTGEITKQLF